MKIQKYIMAAIIVMNMAIADAQVPVLTTSVKARVVDNIAKNLKETYIFLDTATRMGNYIRHQLKSGAYDTIKTPSVFASVLTSDLLSVYHDGHLSISYTPKLSSDNQKEDQDAAKARRAKFRKTVNFGFEKAEVLEGNVGYLKIKGFFAPDSATKIMAQTALRFVSNSNSLILDLRDNMGGDPGLVSYLCSFFFDGKTHLNDLYTRKDHSTTTYWTTPDTILSSLKTIPIYILTSHHTFSAGEELTYDLQTRKRAVVIGEVTGGGAHPVYPYAIGDDFTANIPFARAINPITKTNWEGTGVKPDIETKAGDALEVALKKITGQ